MLFERAAVIGVGLIGGSFALGARRRGLLGSVVGVGRSAENLEVARRAGAIDSFTHDVAEGVRDADLVFLSVPVSAIGAVMESCAPVLRAGTIVTDAGSVKQSVIDAVEPHLPPNVDFVPAHPIAGGEKSGAAHADADLFVGRDCILSPTASASAQSVERVRSLWAQLGMEVSELDAARHDAIMARVSHLPHVLAFALVNAVGDADAEALGFSGASFADLTRIADSPVAVWRDILLENADAVRRSLAEMRSACDEFDAAVRDLRADKLVELIERSHGYKARLPGESDE